MNKAARHNARRQTDMIIEPRSLITSISRFRFHGFRCSIRSVCVCVCVCFAPRHRYIYSRVYIYIYNSCSCKHVKSSSFNHEGKRTLSQEKSRTRVVLSLSFSLLKESLYSSRIYVDTIQWRR